VDAIAANAAAVAVRVPYSFSWFDYDVTVGISFPAAFRSTDFDNDGATGFTYENFLFYSFGGQVQAGPWGLGLLGDFQTYDLLPAQRTGDPQVTETLGRLHLVGGRSFLGGQLSLGGGIRAVMFSMDSQQNGVEKNQLSMENAGPELGVLVRPDYVPWRLGATFRAPVEGRGTAAIALASLPVPLVNPASILLPWELEMGAVIQLGPRPLNPTWLDPHEQEAEERRQIDDDRAARQAAQDAELGAIDDVGRKLERARELAAHETVIRREEDRRFVDARQRLLLERRAHYSNWARERITVLVELLVSGKASEAVGLESFFSAQSAMAKMMPLNDLRRSGQGISYSPRLGIEGEPVPDLLQIRFGTYIEPSRLGGQARQHFTFGFELKLIPWTVFGIVSKHHVWSIGGVADLAPRYQSFGLSLGAWH